MGLKRGKWYCPVCGWAAKGACPQHPGDGVPVSSQWRPGRKGSRTRLWDERVPERRAWLMLSGRRSKARHRPSYPAYRMLVNAGRMTGTPVRDRWRDSHGVGVWGEDPVRVAIRARAGKHLG